MFHLHIEKAYISAKNLLSARNLSHSLRVTHERIIIPIRQPDEPLRLIPGPIKLFRSNDSGVHARHIPTGHPFESLSDL
jgi:hypothetical protein